MTKIIRITTVPGSFLSLLSGQLKFMGQYFEMVAVSGKGYEQNGESLLYKVSLGEESRTIEVEMTRKITPIKDLIAVYILYKVFKKEKPQIVHSHTPKAGTLSMIAAKYAGVPHRLHTIAGLPLVEVTGFKRSILNWVEKLTYAHATMIYPNSFGLKKIILDHKFTSERKLRIIGKGSSNGINTVHFDETLFSEEEKNQLKLKTGILPTDFVFIFMGRMVRDKGINELIGAFKNINKQFKNTKLLLLGAYEKELDPLFTDTEAEIDSNLNIKAIGWQADVRPFLAISDTLVFPSYREGFPNTVMQASAMGLPCIVSDINGCNEIIKDGVNGIVIPVKNQQAIEEAMKKIIGNDDFRHSLTLKSREMICENYSQQYVWNEILKEYKQLLD